MVSAMIFQILLQRSDAKLSTLPYGFASLEFLNQVRMSAYRPRPEILLSTSLVNPWVYLETFTCAASWICILWPAPCDQRRYQNAPTC